MLIEFKCPRCVVTLRAGIKLAGNKGTCPKCRKEVIVPKLSKTLRKKR